MTKEEKQNWLAVDKAKLFVQEEYFHHHAYEILTTHSKIKDAFVKSMSSEISIETRIKTGTSKGIKAKDLNIEIRRLLKTMSNMAMKFEVSEERGVFYFSAEKGSIGGFDFAILNHKKNIAALRNLCFGELQYFDGEKRWKNFLSKNSELTKIAESFRKKEPNGTDYNYNEPDTETPLLVGEIQFGNWALAYRDFFKVLKANVQNSIDCLIYVVPMGNLENMLSDGIVTFDKTKAILKDFAKVISVPVWVVGLDMEEV